MSDTQIFRTVQSVIATVAKIPESDVKPENPVTGLANVDSIMLLEIIARTELALGIDIEEEQLFRISTVGEFVAVCEQLTDSAARDNGGDRATPTQAPADLPASDVLRA